MLFVLLLLTRFSGLPLASLLMLTVLASLLLAGLSVLTTLTGLPHALARASPALALGLLIVLACLLAVTRLVTLLLAFALLLLPSILLPALALVVLATFLLFVRHGSFSLELRAFSKRTQRM